MKKFIIVALGYAIVGYCDVGAMMGTLAKSVTAELPSNEVASNAQSVAAKLTDNEVASDTKLVAAELTDNEVEIAKKAYETMSGLRVDGHLEISEEIVGQILRGTKRFHDIFIRKLSPTLSERDSLNIMAVDIQRASKSYSDTLHMVGYLVFKLKIREFIDYLLSAHERQSSSAKTHEKDKAADVLHRIYLGEKDVTYTPPAREVDLESLKKALSKEGADVNSDMDNNGVTLLHFAAAYGNIDAVRLLLDAKANVNAKDRYGKMPWQYAEEYGNKDIAELLHNYPMSIHNAK